MNPAEVISIVSLAIATPSAVAAAVSLVFAFRESRRRDREIGLLQDEATRREEELALLREQVRNERDDRSTEKRARLTIVSTHRSSSANGIEFGFRITNAGPHFAANLMIRLRGNEGRLAGETFYSDPILAGGPPVEITVTTRPPDAYFGPYKVEPSWDDGRGRIVERLRIEVARP